MRRRYLVTYDICDDKRLKKIFQLMNNYGDHLQFSVFLCELNEVEKIRMQSEVKKNLNEKEDQVLILDLGGVQVQMDDKHILTLGRPLALKTRAKIV